MPRQIAIAFVLWSATAVAAPPGGRVMRVERTTGSSNVAPRLCEVHSGICLGDEPKVGQTVLVLDERHVAAEFQIVEVTNFAAGCTNLWTVKTRALRGAATDSDAIGVIDPNLNPDRARLLDKPHLPASPSGISEEEVWRAIDRDGDGTADILITRYSCDASGRPMTGGNAPCVDVWARLGPRLTRTFQLNFARCNP